MPPLVLFDGHCALCSGFVQRLLEADARGVLHFAPLQALDTHDDLVLARYYVDQTGLDVAALDSVLFIDARGEVYVKSDAFFAILRALGEPYDWLGILQVLPKGLRDGVYDTVAKYRYRVIGRHEACWLPRPEWRGRFLGEA